MAWRKQLRTASFRGIRFNLLGSESSFGRRTANHEFPKRDEPYTEDLGKKAAEFSIEAYISGFDYLRNRDRLVKACETAGPGKLVHPFYGNRQVVCTACDIRESAQDGGIAFFRLTFRTAGKLQFPVVKKDPKGLLETIGAGVDEKSSQEFLNTYTLASQPAFVVASAQEKVTDFIDALEASTSFITRNADEIADLAFAITDLRNDLDEIIHTPEVLATRIQNSFSLLKQSISGRKESLDTQRGFFGFGSADTYSSVNTLTRATEESNLRALNRLIARAALVQASLDIAEVEFESVQEAEYYRDLFLDEINSQQEAEDVSDDVFQSLDQLRAELRNAAPREDQDLPNLVDVTLKTTTNSLALCYELYESLERETDIINRNELPHPGLIPGGETIQVLRNG